MPVEVGIWRLGDQAVRVNATPMDSESRLEELLADDLSILAPNLLILGRQVTTAHGKRIDLLAMDAEGLTYVIEIKRNRTPRDVVAQALDYGSWVQGLSYADIAELCSSYHDGKALEEVFSEFFGTHPPENLNTSHQLIIVASELDPSTERIISYLSEVYAVPINAVFFQYFRDGDHEYLSRSWFSDPFDSAGGEGRAPRVGHAEPWNQRDFYVAVGEGEHRNWDDFRRFGFICGGAGRWYSRSLYNLFPGARVFACIPQTGYVGVGIVKQEAVPFREFKIHMNGSERSLDEVDLSAPQTGHDKDDDDLCEHVVSVEWIKEVPREDAYWETGMFANQNTACRMRNQFTLERLLNHFEIDD